jgi:hypothetical protein
VVIKPEEDSEVQYQRDDGRLVSDSMKLVTRATIAETDTPRAANPPDRTIVHSLLHIEVERSEGGEWWVYIPLLVFPTMFVEGYGGLPYRFRLLSPLSGPLMVLPYQSHMTRVFSWCRKGFGLNKMKEVRGAERVSQV